MTIARQPPAAFADLCTPEQVGEDLARSLAALLCRGLEHDRGEPCAGCRAAGRVLAPPIGRALLGVRLLPVSDRRAPRIATADDYAAVGRSLELLERGAGTRRA